MGKRRYNQIISCDETPNGYWRVYVNTPQGEIRSHLYIGYSRAEAIRKARRHNFDKGALAGQPSR